MSIKCMQAVTMTDLERYVINVPTMGTCYSAIVCGSTSLDIENLERQLERVVSLVDGQMSTWKPHSDLMRLNRAPLEHWVTIPVQLFEVLEAALEIQRLSNGAFDISVGDAVNAWGFGAQGPELDLKTIKEQGQISAPVIQEPAFELDADGYLARRLLPRQLDLSGIAKGYAVDLMAEIVEQFGIQHYLVSIDGELRTAGCREDGAPWCIAVEIPDPSRRAAGEYLEICDIAVATSGSYRHQRQIGNLIVSHTMDGRSLKPALTGTSSVTVFCKSCMQADAWATALMVLGPSEGGRLAQELGLEAKFTLPSTV